MITAYLTFNGNTEEAFHFYKSILGGEITSFQRFGDTEHGAHMPETDRNKVMHAALESPSGTLMGSDHVEGMGGPLHVGNNFSLSLDPRSEEQAKQLFEGLSDGGVVTMPLDKTFWGAIFGMFTDKFGVNWLVNYQLSE